MSEVLSRPPTSTARFSYADLTPEAEHAVRSAAAAIKAVTARSIREIGQHLLLAKAALPHGAFTVWAETELGISGRSARNYMTAAQWLDGKPETVADLPPSVIYALASPTAPSEVVEHVIAVAETGASIDVVAVQTRLITAKIEQSQLKKAQRRNRKPVTLADIRKRQRQEVEDYARQCAEAEDKIRIRLRPLALQVAALGSRVVYQLFEALQHTHQQVLHELVKQALREGAR